MIDNRSLTADEWQVILYVIATVLFVLGVLFKMLSDSLHKKLDALKRDHELLEPCPFCGKIPEVSNGCYICKHCQLVMRIPFRYYKSVEDMVNQTWNRRYNDEHT